MLRGVVLFPSHDPIKDPTKDAEIFGQSSEFELEMPFNLVELGTKTTPRSTKLRQGGYLEDGGPLNGLTTRPFFLNDIAINQAAPTFNPLLNGMDFVDDVVRTGANEFQLRNQNIVVSGKKPGFNNPNPVNPIPPLAIDNSAPSFSPQQKPEKPRPLLP